MIVHDVVQGTEAWLMLRLGIPTASRFDTILTAKTRKYSASARTYINELVAEWIMGEPIYRPTNFAMERGTDLEPHAANWYAFEHDVEVVEVGFVTNDDGTVGASPDRLVGTAGLLEIKCPLEAGHVANLLGDEIAKPTQVQGQLWVAEREWCDTVSYHPAMPQAVVRIYRDEDYIADLATAMDQFLEELQAAKEQVEALGPVGRREIIRALEAA